MGGSSGSVTITNKKGLNMWWYAVTLSVPSGVTVTSLKMRDSTMMSWETGISEWDYYKFTANKPYSAPFHFKVTISSGQEYIGYNVINSISEGDSGRVSLAFAFTAGGVAAIVISAVLVCCIFGALLFVYRRKNRVIAA